MKRIPLGGIKGAGKFALVDDDDYGRLIIFRWHWSRGYAVRKYRTADGIQKRLLMHRIIAKTRLGFETDHINGDCLDNRKKNLRECLHSENSRNRIKLSARNKSGYHGVYFDSDRQKWRATVRIDNKVISAGRFNDKKEAALARDKIAVKYHGEFATLNFP